MFADVSIKLLPHFLRFLTLNTCIQLILLLSYPLMSFGYVTATLIPIYISNYRFRRNERNDCILEHAEACFNTLFDTMPICLGSELNFRCHHFKVHFLLTILCFLICIFLNRFWIHVFVNRRLSALLKLLDK